MTQPLPPAGHTARLDVWAAPEPAHTSRHDRINRWLTTVALTIGIILMLITLTGAVTALTILGGLRERITTNTPAPEPALTGCPWNETECEAR